MNEYCNVKNNRNYFEFPALLFSKPETLEREDLKNIMNFFIIPPIFAHLKDKVGSWNFKRY